MIKVLIVDDIKLLRECLTLAINNHSDFKVVGCAVNGAEAYQMCASLKPDVVLMDIIMPTCDGIEATHKIKTSFPEIKVLILTTVREEHNINRVISNGADGYVLKDIGRDELLLSIRSVFTGLNLINPIKKINAKSEEHDLIMNSQDIENRINKSIIVKDSDGEISAEIRSRAMEIVNAALKMQKKIDKNMLLSQNEVDNALD